MYEILGWIGSVAFALCATPQAIKCARQGHTRGLSPWFLALMLLGEVCYVVSVWGLFGFVLWMMLNYFLNILWVLIIYYYYFWPRNPDGNI